METHQRAINNFQGWSDTLVDAMATLPMCDRGNGRSQAGKKASSSTDSFGRANGNVDTMKRWLVLIPLWIGLGVVNAGFVNADFRERYPELYQSKYLARDGRSFALAWSILGLPIALPFTLLVTGWYSAGWTLDDSPFPCTKENSDIWCKGNMENEKRK